MLQPTGRAPNIFSSCSSPVFYWLLHPHNWLDETRWFSLGTYSPSPGCWLSFIPFSYLCLATTCSIYLSSEQLKSRLKARILLAQKPKEVFFNQNEFFGSFLVHFMIFLYFIGWFFHWVLFFVLRLNYHYRKQMREKNHLLADISLSLCRRRKILNSSVCLIVAPSTDWF